jgi:hypothetical protein
MKRFTLMTTLGLALLGGGPVAAETAAPKPPAAAKTDEHAAHHPDKAAPGAGKGAGMMGEGMNGMMGMCPAMMGGDAKFEVKNLAKGVTITMTSEDAKEVAKIQKMAEGMRLMHEAHAK